ncbi:MAG: dihydrodipicolinate synthase family protein [Alphaproteobacteria bacterium]|nr:dihydrodipicolinate synthase family protein [Alphaproteobacteria bacterium]
MQEHRPSHRLAGVWAAALTAADDQLALDIGRSVAHARWLLAHGCDGVLLLGTTGEANSLSYAERLDLIGASAATIEADRLMIGIGSSSLADAVALGRTSLAAGCPNLLALPPFYYKTASEDGLFAFFAEVIERIGDPRLRLFLYNIPKLSGVAVTVELFARLVTAFPGTVEGIKDAAGDWLATERLIADFPDHAIFCGPERFLLETLRAGGAGCIASTANVLAPLLQRQYRAWRTPEADRLQAEVEASRAALDAAPMVAALKALTRRRSGDAAWRNLLPPLQPLAPDVERALFARLAAIRFFDLVPEMAAA